MKVLGAREVEEHFVEAAMRGVHAGWRGGGGVAGVVVVGVQLVYLGVAGIGGHGWRNEGEEE